MKEIKALIYKSFQKLNIKRENKFDIKTHATLIYFVLLIITYLFSEIEPSFPYRDVTVRRGVEFKDDYDIQAELGR